MELINEFFGERDTKEITSTPLNRSCMKDRFGNFQKMASTRLDPDVGPLLTSF